VVLPRDRLHTVVTPALVIGEKLYASTLVFSVQLMRGRKRLLVIAATLVHTRFASAQTPGAVLSITLDQARQMALKQHPRVASSALYAESVHAFVKEARAAFYTQVTGAFTSAAADHGTTLAAGILQTSSLYSRVAAGVNVTQLLTDFGRTSNLADSAQLRASAQDQATKDTRAQVLIEVSSAYYQALAAWRVLEVAEAIVANRRLLLRQVTALAASALKSTLDVRFAEVAVSQAELGLYRAQNDAEATQTRLNGALGNTRPAEFDLADEALPPPLPPDATPLVDEAIQNRPDLAAFRLSAEAAHRFSNAEGKLRRPTLSLLGTVGGLPATDPHLRQEYAAAAVNLSVPILNGGLFSAREREAELKAQANDKDLQSLTIAVTQQVRLAWLQANTAFRRLDVTARLVDETSEALRLAQARYDSGLGGIVELNQAQLAQVSAQIDAASAKYEYLTSRAALDFTTGRLQ
jgi:outer membrane protein